MNGFRAGGGLAARLTLLVTGAALACGVLFLGLATRIIQRWEAEHQQVVMDALLAVSATTATDACFAGDPALSAQVVQDLVRTGRVTQATLSSEGKVLAQAGTAQGPLRFRRKLYSPFTPDLEVGELSVTAVPGPYTARAEALLWKGLGARILVLAATLALCLTLFLALPLRTHLQAVRALDPSAPARLRLPLGHHRDELGGLAEAVNGLMDRFQRALDQERAVQDRLLQDKRKAQAILDNLGAGVCVLRRDGALDTWNPAFLRLLDLQHTPPAPGTPIAPLFQAAAGPVARCLEQCRAEAAEAAVLFRVRRPPNHIWLKLRLRPIGPDWIQGHLEERSLHGAQLLDVLDGTDPATGTLNRFGADLAIEDHLANQTQGLGLLLVGLEPRPLEEGALHEAGRRLALPLGPGDKVAHLEDGDFLILVEGLDDPRRAQALGRAILVELAAPWPPSCPPVTGRLGVALWDPDGEPSRQALLERADAALRQAGPSECRVG